MMMAAPLVSGKWPAADPEVRDAKTSQYYRVFGGFPFSLASAAC
jgi:hypothetical protein